MMPLKASASI